MPQIRQQNSTEYVHTFVLTIRTLFSTSLYLTDMGNISRLWVPTQQMKLPLPYPDQIGRK